MGQFDVFVACAPSLANHVTTLHVETTRGSLIKI
jgi:hypothetical protein